jgi:S1-C subfamily serine protease
MPAGRSVDWGAVFEQTAPDVAVVDNQAAAITGTAFFIDDHHALTNAHVVTGATHVQLTAFSSDGSREATPRDARVLALDATMDLAVLSVAEPAAGHLTVTNTDDIRVGDDVMAIGEPHGLGWTATFGRIGAVRMGGDLNLSPGLTALQFDAAINPGNSGGPLIARDGSVIGIVTFGMRNANGLSFAIAGEPLWTRAREWIAHEARG